ncbi:hypothetical protein DBV05_g132 [Lasiodiplodia theobromae]|uniref:Uncharacterized protein n=1 Tax=Lasiodiplodia theobromae TaxID=45133 RepID=A0A5N5DY59_9PEZI|nr:hypothetical protein DBV05_g132 [Lasiodiplodia theobromae]
MSASFLSSSSSSLGHRHQTNPTSSLEAVDKATKTSTNTTTTMSAPSSPQFVFRAGGAGVVRRNLFTSTTTIAGKKRGTWTRFSGSSSTTSSNSFSASASSSASASASGPGLLSRGAGSDEHYDSGSSSNNKRRRTSSAAVPARCWPARGAGMNKLWEKMFGRGVKVIEKTPSAADSAAAGGSGGGSMAVEKWVKGEGVLRRILAVGEAEGEEEMRDDGEEEEDVEEMVERENEELVVLREVLGAVLEMFQGEREEEGDDDDDFVVPFCMAEWR